MYQILDKSLKIFFKVLLFFLPLTLWIYTSELFEFNKIIVLYILSVLIAGAWLGKIIVSKKLIFRRTVIDIPLLAFLLSQLISTLVSIDPRTSWLGYYSRFNGGMASLACYAFLYWAYVSNFEKKDTFANIKIILASATLVSIYGILEKFGIDKDVWVQDVQQRVFSTLGQPNWLGTWLIALIPLTYIFIGDKENKKMKLVGIILSLVFFITLLFTKSRSALLGFGIGSFILVFGTFIEHKSKDTIKNLAKIFVPMIILCILVGTPLTPSIFGIGQTQKPTPANVPVLESGGTESGEIRKIVWKGAVEVWRHYPLAGTGVETFAYSYYKFRPLAHNLVSEWDFLYNKAHNEYLNYLANTGILGLLGYLSVIGFSLFAMFKHGEKYRWLFISGYVAVAVSNFFGFSVVPVNLIFFLLPALALTINHEDKENEKDHTLNLNTKLGLSAIWIIVAGFMFLIIKYWYADTLYAMGKSYNDDEKFIEGRKYMANAVQLSPNEAIYWDELSQSSAGLAAKLYESKEDLASKEAAGFALKEIAIAEKLSPRNLNIKRDKYFILLKLLPIDKTLLTQARDGLVNAIELAPTDAKLYYHLAITFMRMGQDAKSEEVLLKTIEMKPNYKDARLAYAILLGESGRTQKAIEELNYILKNIDSRDEFVKAQLDKYTK
jgi:putative inorganic carbon (HCO3(-)) transporter